MWSRSLPAMTRSLHIHLDAVGGIAGDMFVPAVPQRRRAASLAHRTPAPGRRPMPHPSQHARGVQDRHAGRAGAPRSAPPNPSSAPVRPAWAGSGGGQRKAPGADGPRGRWELAIFCTFCPCSRARRCRLAAAAVSDHRPIRSAQRDGYFPATRPPDARVASSSCATQPVGETGFEPAAPASRTQCSTRLSYSPLPLPRSGRVRAGAADGVGFEPTRAVNPTRFPIVLLKPLGHPSRVSLPVRRWAGARKPPRAERVGFEPTRALRARRFSKPLP